MKDYKYNDILDMKQCTYSSIQDRKHCMSLQNTILDREHHINCIILDSKHCLYSGTMDKKYTQQYSVQYTWYTL
jgi:hypothetical protein